MNLKSRLSTNTTELYVLLVVCAVFYGIARWLAPSLQAVTLVGCTGALFIWLVRFVSFPRSER